MASSLHSFGGVLILFGLAWLCSQNRSAIKPKTAAIAFVIQLLLALVLIKWPKAGALFATLNDIVVALQAATEDGTSFVFGFIGGGPAPFVSIENASSFVLAFQALPLIIVLSALTTLLTYWRVLPWIVNLVSKALQRGLGIGGAIGLGSAANIFVGMVEAPLFVRPYLKHLTRSELFVLMCTGMATIAGTVLVLYATFLADVIENPAGHLFVASLISIPAAIAVALILVPETASPTDGDAVMDPAVTSSMAAIVNGTENGLKLCLQITALLIVLIALVSLVNILLAAALPTFGDEPLTLERLLGFIMAPLAFVIGIPWSEAPTAGQLLGTKTVLNELIAYRHLAELPIDALSNRSKLILTYALCGFANIGSLGILIGGIATMAPSRKDDVISLGPLAILGGTLATLMTGAVIGIII